MKKSVFSVLLVILMVASLMLSVTGCGKEEIESVDPRIAQLEEENAALREQLDALTAELDSMKQRAALQDWNLSADAWNDGNGATVTFTATPVNYVEGQRAALSVRMGDLEAESTNCVWDGSAFVGSVELSAADGYSYYCILTSLDGSQEEIALNSPENVTNEMLVYLGSNLTAYANLVVENWTADNKALSIQSGYIQVQMPRLSAAGAGSVSNAALVLQLNGKEVERQAVTLPAGEGDNSYELALSDIRFAMPDMEDDYQIDLVLEVSLSNGTTLNVSGGSWYSNNDELVLVVG